MISKKNNLDDCSTLPEEFLLQTAHFEPLNAVSNRSAMLGRLRDFNIECSCDEKIVDDKSFVSVSNFDDQSIYERSFII